MTAYQELRESFEWEKPHHYNFARDVIDKWAEQDPNKLAMIWTDGQGTDVRRTFAEISSNSKKVANVLSAAGVKRGDTVIIVLSRQIAWWETVTACTRMGVIYSPGTTQLSANDIAYRINSTNAVAVVTDLTTAPKLDDISSECPSLVSRIVVDGDYKDWINYDQAVAAAAGDYITAETESDENALCFFTSGTTGYPKMCIHNHIWFGPYYHG